MSPPAWGAEAVRSVSQCCFASGFLHLRALDTRENLYGIGTLNGAEPEKSAPILTGILDHLVIPESPKHELNIVFLLEKLVVRQAGFGQVIRRHPTGSLFEGTVPEKQGLEDIPSRLEILSIIEEVSECTQRSLISLIGFVIYRCL